MFGSVWFRLEQISAVTDPRPEHFCLDRTNTVSCFARCVIVVAWVYGVTRWCRVRQQLRA